MLKIIKTLTKSLSQARMAEFSTAAPQKVKIAVGQLMAINDRRKNFELCADFVKEAAENSAKMIFLPENFNWLTTTKGETAEVLERIPEGKYFNMYCELARKHNIHLSLGGFQEKVDDEKNRMCNTHLIIDNQGKLIKKYQKIHLFDIHIDEINKYIESSYVRPGEKIEDPVDTPAGKLGLSICYDLRFPELYRTLAERGAEVLTVPAAFLHKTGEAHWHILLRARAIENTCYVIAAAQTGQHFPTRRSFGHSLVVNPWGDVLLDMKETVGVGYAELDFDLLRDIRSKLPCLKHRKPEVYFQKL